MNLYHLIEQSDLLSEDFPLSLWILRHQRKLFISSLSSKPNKPGKNKFAMDGKEAM